MVTTDATVIQPDPVLGDEVVYPHIIAQLDGDKELEAMVMERAEFGKKKYKRYLMICDGRNTDIEIIQKLLDAMFYSQKGCLENKGNLDEMTYRYVFRSSLALLRLIVAKQKQAEPTTEF